MQNHITSQHFLLRQILITYFKLKKTTKKIFTRAKKDPTFCQKKVSAKPYHMMTNFITRYLTLAFLTLYNKNVEENFFPTFFAFLKK